MASQGSGQGNVIQISAVTDFNKALKEIQALRKELDALSKQSQNVLGGGSIDTAVALSAIDPKRSAAGVNIATRAAIQMGAAQTQHVMSTLQAAADVQGKLADASRMNEATAAARQGRGFTAQMAKYGTTDAAKIGKINRKERRLNLDAYMAAHGGRTPDEQKEWAAQQFSSTHAGMDYAEYAEKREGYRQAQHVRSVQRDVMADKRHARRMQRTGGRDDVDYGSAMEDIQSRASARRTAERGGSVIDASKQRVDEMKQQDVSRGVTKSEYRKQIEEERKAEHERRKERRQMRNEDRAAKKADQQQAKSDRMYGQLGNQMLNMLPGGGMLQSFGRYAHMLSPGMASFAQGLPARLGAIGGRVINGSVGIGPPVAGPAGTAGASPLGGGGGFLQPGGIGLAPGVGAGTIAAGFAGGLAMAAVGTVKLGEAGKELARRTVGGQIGALSNQEMIMRSASAAGGAQRLTAAYHEVGDLSQYGIGNTQALQMYSSFLNTRGKSSRMGAGETFGFLNTSARYNVDPSIGGIASSLGYSSAGYNRMISGLQGQAGLGGAALSGAAQSMLAQEQRAYNYGLEPNLAGRNADFAGRLSQSGYGGGQYGGAAVVQKVQGIGGNMADSIRGSMAQMADTLVLADAVKRAGSLTGGIEEVDKMSAEDKMKLLQRGGPGAGGIYGMFGKGLSMDQARGTMRRGVEQAQEPDAAVPLSARAAAHENDLNKQAYGGDLIDAYQKEQQGRERAEMQIANDVAFIAAYLRKKESFVGSVSDTLPAPLAWAVNSLIP